MGVRAYLPLLLLGGCVVAPAPPPADPARPRFDALAFFSGQTEGRGSLRIALHPAQAVTVHGQGRLEPDGTLALDQSVERAGTPPKHRAWRMREVTPGHYAGTLTDAAGPIVGEAAGGRLHLAFAMKGGLRTEQWLTLAPDGRSARNLLIVRAHGLPIARVDETITRTSPLP